jgi:anthranilate/para-aminobenzoate synthase component II
MVIPSKPSEPTPPFTSMDSPFTAARYHSLVIEKETFPHDALEATAWTEDGLIMAARHKKYKHIQVLMFVNVLFHHWLPTPAEDVLVGIIL